MNGYNVPFLFLVVVAVLVTVAFFMLLDLPLWGALLLGFIVAVAGLFGIDVILDLVEKRHHRNGKPPERSSNSTTRQGEKLLSPLPIEPDDTSLPKAPEDLCCPSCGASDVAVIVYGQPALFEALEKALAERQVTLGGCLVYDGAPQWACSSCQTRFGSVQIGEDV